MRTASAFPSSSSFYPRRRARHFFHLFHLFPPSAAPLVLFSLRRLTRPLVRIDVCIRRYSLLASRSSFAHRRRCAARRFLSAACRKPHISRSLAALFSRLFFFLLLFLYSASSVFGHLRRAVRCLVTSHYSLVGEVTLAAQPLRLLFSAALGDRPFRRHAMRPAARLRLASFRRLYQARAKGRRQNRRVGAAALGCHRLRLLVAGGSRVHQNTTSIPARIKSVASGLRCTRIAS